MKPFLPLAATLLALSPIIARAQVGVGTTTPDAKSALDIRATDKGLLIPRLTAAQRTAIASPPQGLMVYQTDGSASGGAQTGFWYYAGPGGWVFIEPTGADNLGNHTATQNLNLTDKLLVGGTAAAPGTQGLKVDASGRVGIGLAAGTGPTEQLHVDGGNAKIGLAQWAATADDRLLKFGDGSFVSLGETGGDDLLQFQARDFRFNASGRSYSGNVGIGLGAAVAPAERLEVGGNIKITGTAGTDGLVFPDGTKQTTAATSGGLTLPYSGTASTVSSVFQITNSGAGSGLRGASASGQGVVGRVNGTGAGQGVVGVKGTTIPNIEDAGVVGLSDADYGVYGRSSQSTGVVGISDGTAASLAGVMGSSTATNGVGVSGAAPGTGVRGVGGTGAGVDGTSSANQSSTGGVVGRNSSGNNAVGVLGLTVGGYGVRGEASASPGAGVYGRGTGTYGVFGVSDTGRGVYGVSTSSYGVQGYSTSSYGVYGATGAGNTGSAAGVTGNSSNGGVGVLGTTTSGYAVRGEASAAGGQGVIGLANGSTGIGVYGVAAAGTAADAVNGVASGTGRAGYFNQTNSSSTANALEVQNASLGRTAFFNQGNTGSTANVVEIAGAGTGTGLAVAMASTNVTSAEFSGNTDFNTTTPAGVVNIINAGQGQGLKLIGNGISGANLYGGSINFTVGSRSISDIYTSASALSSSIQELTIAVQGSVGYPRIRMGYLFNNLMGNWNVTGSLSKGGGSFKIDHPLDPENQYLYHSFVESPDMLNVYNGNVVLDAQGEATVTLPDYFEALNRDFRYQLTPIGAAFTPYVLAEVAGNRFRIAGQPGGRVSWQVTGIRQDKWANQHRIPNAVPKEAENRGKYLHPEAFGQPAARGIGYRATETGRATSATSQPSATKR